MSLLILAAVFAVSIFLVVLGLPGLWLMLGAALLYNWLVPAAATVTPSLKASAAGPSHGSITHW